MPKRKKILFVSARLPYPAIEGHQIRTFGILNQLAKDFDIHLLSLLRDSEVIDTSNKLGMLCRTISGVAIENSIFASIRAVISGFMSSQPLVVAKYVTPNFRCEFKKQVELVKPDIIHLDLLPLADLINIIPKNIKIILNEHNIESDLIKQKLVTLDSYFSKKIYQRELNKLVEFESLACQSVDLVLACSSNDAFCLESLGARHVSCIPNGVDAKRLKPNNNQKSSKTIVFLGGMGWYPNRLGIIWFLEKVFPLILKSDPEVRLQIIGNTEPWVDISDDIKANVEKLGFVDDFIPYVQKATLMIVPLNVGSGTRLKVVEGLALGKCMISTLKGAEGVGLTHNKNVLFSDNAVSFSEEVIRAITNKKLVASIEINARKLAGEVYDWDVIGLKLSDLYSEI
jgi:glycosyltransferase involved in cell wall biosynthesis